jgi:hypothetical protein
MLYWVEKAYYNGMILVAATDNKQKRGFPGDYSSVIAVDFQHFDDFKSFNYYPGKTVRWKPKGSMWRRPFPETLTSRQPVRALHARMLQAWWRGFCHRCPDSHPFR